MGGVGARERTIPLRQNSNLPVFRTGGTGSERVTTFVRPKPVAPGDAPSAAPGVLRVQAGPAPSLHIFGKRASGQGDLGLVDAHENFRTAALPLFPHSHRLPCGVFGARNPSGVDGPADKGFLVGVGRISIMSSLEKHEAQSRHL
jgi:hypothetical protein